MIFSSLGCKTHDMPLCWLQRRTTLSTMWPILHHRIELLCRVLLRATSFLFFLLLPPLISFLNHGGRGEGGSIPSRHTALPLSMIYALALAMCAPQQISAATTHLEYVSHMNTAASPSLHRRRHHQLSHAHGKDRGDGGNELGFRGDD